MDSCFRLNCVVRVRRAAITKRKCIYNRKLIWKTSSSPESKLEGQNTTQKGFRFKKTLKYPLTCSNRSRKRCNCDSNCRLWSSRICIRASKRPLCSRKLFASAINTVSCVFSGTICPFSNELLGLIPFSRVYSSSRDLKKQSRIE